MIPNNVNTISLVIDYLMLLLFSKPNLLLWLDIEQLLFLNIIELRRDLIEVLIKVIKGGSHYSTAIVGN